MPKTKKKWRNNYKFNNNNITNYFNTINWSRGAPKNKKISR